MYFFSTPLDAAAKRITVNERKPSLISPLCGRLGPSAKSEKPQPRTSLAEKAANEEERGREPCKCSVRLPRSVGVLRRNSTCHTKLTSALVSRWPGSKAVPLASRRLVAVARLSLGGEGAKKNTTRGRPDASPEADVTITTPNALHSARDSLELLLLGDLQTQGGMRLERRERTWVRLSGAWEGARK